jgi:hypothetical protein
MVTTGDYAPRCRNIGIECWDGRDFQKQERKWIWIRRLRVGITRTIVMAGVGVFAYSVWDKSYDAHDNAARVRREAVRLAESAWKMAKEWADKMKF